MYSQKNLDTLQQWKEKAEKWDKLCHEDTEATEEYITKCSKSMVPYIRAMIDLKRLMYSLMVREKCSCLCHEVDYEGRDRCKECNCHGTGYITRPATVEEVREMIETILTPYNSSLKSYWKSIGKNDDGWFFELKSGHTLFMKEKDESRKA